MEQELTEEDFISQMKNEVDILNLIEMIELSYQLKNNPKRKRLTQSAIRKVHKRFNGVARCTKSLRASISREFNISENKVYKIWYDFSSKSSPSRKSQ